MASNLLAETTILTLLDLSPRIQRQCENNVRQQFSSPHHVGYHLASSAQCILCTLMSVRMGNWNNETIATVSRLLVDIFVSDKSRRTDLLSLESRNPQS